MIIKERLTKKELLINCGWLIAIAVAGVAQFTLGNPW